jgi:hypothetical protein
VAAPSGEQDAELVVVEVLGLDAPSLAAARRATFSDLETSRPRLELDGVPFEGQYEIEPSSCVVLAAAPRQEGPRLPAAAPTLQLRGQARKRLVFRPAAELFD